MPKKTRSKKTAARLVSGQPNRHPTRGDHHDLQAIFDRLNHDYFADEPIVATIRWGVRRHRPKWRRTVSLGQYVFEERCIILSASLDRWWVPSFVVEFVIYHEMLHQKHHYTVVNGKHQFHTRAFRVEEGTFAQYQEAILWERRHQFRLRYC